MTRARLGFDGRRPWSAPHAEEPASLDNQRRSKYLPPDAGNCAALIAAPSAAPTPTKGVLATDSRLSGSPRSRGAATLSAGSPGGGAGQRPPARDTDAGLSV